MKKLRVAVIFGGCSPEYSVSLESAHAVITHMDRTRYSPVLVGISQAGNWLYFTGSAEKIKADTWNNPADCAPVLMSLDRDTHGILVQTAAGMEKISLDAAFPVLHGRGGEDGTVQGVFELAGVPLVGCGVLASALCMDKDRAHRLARAAGVNVPASAAANRDELPAAIRLAFEYDDHILLEEAISGFEVGCAVLGNDDLTVGELDEIELADGFFSYTEKYTLKTSAIHVPARIPAAKAAEMKKAAQRIYRALGCRGFARVDMFLDEKGRIVFNEVNTIPGFTAHSRYPSMMKAIGMSFEQVVSSAIELAVAE